MNPINTQTLPGAASPREDICRELFATAAILAGGKSSRMGFDKQLLTDNNRRILETVSDTLKSEFSDILIVTAKPELYEGLNVRVCSDEFQNMGPLAGIHAALSNGRSKYVYLIACDMPVVSLPYIRHIKQRISETGAKVCVCRRNDRFEPFNGFYSRELLPDVEQRLKEGSSSLFRFISASEPLIVSEETARKFDREFRMFTNINTRSEYDAYLGGLV
ncbi:MAG: molybdenum cofactor guanylyltransferase [Clostridia bacterium]|nr:molybdenum cofactor guanylyltransferase [Clostridia bacterium]